MLCHGTLARQIAHKLIQELVRTGDKETNEFINWLNSWKIITISNGSVLNWLLCSTSAS